MKLEAKALLFPCPKSRPIFVFISICLKHEKKMLFFTFCRDSNKKEIKTDELKIKTEYKSGTRKKQHTLQLSN